MEWKLDLIFHGWTFTCQYPSPPVHLLNNVITSLEWIKGRDSLGSLFLTPRSNASVFWFEKWSRGPLLKLQSIFMCYAPFTLTKHISLNQVLKTEKSSWNTGTQVFTQDSNLACFIICNQFKSVSSFYEGNNFKLCLTKQLLNMFKLWCEWGLRTN